MVPIGVVVFVNIVLLLFIIKANFSCCRKDKMNLHKHSTRNSIRKYRQRLISMIATCSVNMGLTWIFAFIAVIPADDYTRTVFSFLFCFFNSFQGFFVFVAYILLSKIKYTKIVKVIEKTLLVSRVKLRLKNNARAITIETKKKPAKKTYKVSIEETPQTSVFEEIIEEKNRRFYDIDDDLLTDLNVSQAQVIASTASNVSDLIKFETDTESNMMASKTESDLIKFESSNSSLSQTNTSIRRRLNTNMIETMDGLNKQRNNSPRLNNLFKNPVPLRDDNLNENNEKIQEGEELSIANDKIKNENNSQLTDTEENAKVDKNKADTQLQVDDELSNNTDL